MKILLILLFTLLTLNNTSAIIIYAQNDTTAKVKAEVLNQLTVMMGPYGSASYVNAHEKYILWTNRAAILEKDGEYSSTTLQSFTMPTLKNTAQLKKIILQQTGLALEDDQIGGILIANPYEAAIMYYKVGFLGKGPNEEDGRVAPAVIIYHELSHAKDSLISPDYFTDMAASFNSRYNNGAEESAVQQQNDFLLTAMSQGLNLGSIRQSYGRNDIVLVSSPWSVPIP